MTDQFAHLLKQAAAQQQNGEAFFRYAHVATYDPATHRVQVIVPAWRDEDGNPVMTGWLPLGSPWVGAGWGMQWAPMGGATLANPTAGEQVMVGLFDRNRGVFAIPCHFFTQVQLPPGGLAPGELILRHATGSFLRLHASGDIETNTQGNVIVAATGNATVTAAGNASVTATGTATVTAAAVNIVGGAIKLCKALTDTLQGLCTAAFEGWAASHTHSGVQSGGDTSGPPSAAPPSNSLTTVLTAE